MIFNTIRPCDFVCVPWKNGGGETFQIAIFPQDASLANFDWRVSRARVAKSGPFSAFPGVDRSLAVISGGELQLRLWNADGAAPENAPITVILSADNAPIAFSGDTRVESVIGSGRSVVDFNVMTRRGRFTHHLKKMVLDRRVQITGRIIVLYCTAGSIEVRSLHSSDSTTLTSGEAMIVSEVDLVEVILQLDPLAVAELWIAFMEPARDSDG